MYTRSTRSTPLGCVPAGAASAALGQRREVLDEEHRQRVARTQGRGLPAQGLAGWRLASAVARIADVDATLAHLRHIGHKVVALHRDIAEAPALRQKLQEAPTWMAGEVLVPIAHAHQFEVVLLMERNRVVRALAWMHAARRDVEPDARVGVDALLEIGDADHDVVDARKHSIPPVLVDAPVPHYPLGGAVPFTIWPALSTPVMCSACCKIRMSSSGFP